jgi:radical SAM superfamily enzyme YgiQ (UPF0313 family)
MKIAFVRPSMSGQRSSDALQPLVFALIKALTPPQVEITFHDAMIGRLPDDLDADAVAMTVETFTARSAYALADAYRARGVPVIMGGFHPSLLPDECAEHADAVVVGEAEDTWPTLLADLEAGRLRPRYVSRNDADLSVLGDDTVFDRADYPPLGLVQFGRGCRYACDFCSVHAFYGRSIRTKPLAVAIEEVRRRPERLLFFVDDNLVADPTRARALFEALVGMGKRWVAQVSMDAAADLDLLRLMRRAGCIMVLIGFESLDRDNLRQMGKGANLMGDYARVLANISAAGLMVYGTFVLGYDSDTSGAGEELVRFATRSGFAIANFNPLMPMPGTALLARLRAEGRLTHDRWWDAEGFRYGDAMFVPRGMTSDALASACRQARYAFYSPASIGRRVCRPRTNARSLGNLVLYLTGNLISRREIHAKQGRRLGVPEGVAR